MSFCPHIEVRKENLETPGAVPPIKVMVAEDNEILRQDFCEMIMACPDMELAGSAASGAEIVRLSLSADVDMILMDIEMEKYQDGIEAAGILSVQKPRTGIIFLTVHEDDETVYRAFSVPTAKNYIVKSAEHAAILQSIRDAYKEMRGAPPSIVSKIQREFSRMKHAEIDLLSFMGVFSRITQAEKEIIRLLLDNYKIDEIARMRRVETVTIKSQINKLLKKFRMRRTREIVEHVKELKLEFLFQSTDGSR
jgi:Response regulator containing a CheY-like receiver domain and an HTH DNA-binding domain